MTSEELLTIPILTMPQVAIILQVSEAYAYRLAQSGELPSIRLGRVVRVRQEDLQKFIERNRQALA